MATPSVSVSWSSVYSGWHAKSRPSDKPFTPSWESLLFAQLRNAPAEHDGFIVGFFSPNIAVDSMGRVLCVPAEQFDAMVRLAQQTLELPDTGSFRNTWRIKHEKSDRDIRRLLVKEEVGGHTTKETSVYGYEKDRETLAKETQGRTTLPSILMELFGLLEEATDGYIRGREDSTLIDVIKALL